MEKKVQFDGVEIMTESFGSPHHPALLLIMGATCSMLWWEDPFCELMARRGFYVIRYDNRDTGLSTCYPQGEPGYTFEALSEDAIRVLDSYGIQRAILMGMSMGGFLAQMLAVRHPDRVKGLVLLSTMYFAEGAEDLPYSSDEVNSFFEALASLSPQTPDEYAELAFRQWMVTAKSDRPKDEVHLRNLCRRDVERSSSYASRLNHSVAQVTGNELTRVGEITAPTLVIHGTMDQVIPPVHGEMLVSAISGAMLQLLTGAGHELHPLDYQAVAAGIERMRF